MDLKASMIMLAKLVGIYGAYNILKFVVLLIVGVVADVASSGAVTVPTLINDTINASIVTAAAGFEAIDAGVTIVLGLIGLVVILQLFWGIIKSYMGADKGKGKGNNNF